MRTETEIEGFLTGYGTTVFSINKSQWYIWQYSPASLKLFKRPKTRVALNGKSPNWESISAGVSQGSVLGPLFFLNYTNDTFLFSVVDDANVTARALKHDLEKINLWAWHWKMQFNANKRRKLSFLSRDKK